MSAVLRPYVAGGVTLAALLFFWQGEAYVNYSEGVYLASGQLIVDGAVPYEDFLAAHPPLLYYVSAAVAAVADSMTAARLLLAVVPLLTGACAAIAVWRLTGHRVAAVAAGIATSLTPWMLHEHAVLVPETLGAPLLMGAALLAARKRTAVWGGAVAAAAIGIKWPFVLPGALLVLATPERGRFALGFLATFGAGVIASFAVFGGGLDDQVLTAHGEVDWRGLRITAGLAAQAAWNVGPLVVLGAAALALRGRTRDQPQLYALAAVAAGALVHLLTLTKGGVAVHIVLLAEPPLVALGAAGLVWAGRNRAWLLAAVALLAVQSAALLLDPLQPGIFVRPFSAPGYAWQASDTEVERMVAAARACPEGVAYSGVPYYAFAAGRRLPGDEPDAFLLTFTDVGKAAGARVAADQPLCP